MVVAAALVELHVHGSHSLKEKRGVVQSIKQRLRNRFNVAVAEVGGQETWQIAVIGLATVDSAFSGPGSRLEVEHTVDAVRHRVRATVVATPFFNPKRKTATPPW